MAPLKHWLGHFAKFVETKNRTLTTLSTDTYCTILSALRSLRILNMRRVLTIRKALPLPVFVPISCSFSHSWGDQLSQEATVGQRPSARWFLLSEPLTYLGCQSSGKGSWRDLNLLHMHCIPGRRYSRGKTRARWWQHQTWNRGCI